MNILLLEDDEPAALRILGLLKAQGHVLHWLDDRCLAAPLEGCNLAIVGPPTSSSNLAGRVGALRQRHPAMPILALLPTTETQTRVAALHAGADDCLPREFDPSELAARIEAFARRTAPADGPILLRANDIEMNLLRREVTRAGRAIALKPQEFRILEYLIRHSDRIVSRTMLLEAMGKTSESAGPALVETQICRLRAKLNRDAQADVIQTVRGAGYRIRVGQ